MDANARSGPIAGVVRDLERVRTGARRLLALRALAMIVAWVAGTALIVGLLDYLLRMPVGLRLALWLVGLFLLAEALRRTVWPALKFKPTLTEVALRLERTVEAKGAGLSGVLASGLEFAREQAGDAGPLRESVMDEAVRRLKAVRAARAVLAPGRARLGLLLAAAALAPIVALAALRPALARIGAERVFIPWTTTAWPKRTAVADATTLAAHPLGAAVPLKAIISRTDREPGRTDVWAHYRLITDDQAGPLRRALLTGQRRTGDLGAGVSGELYERLIEPAGLSVATEERQPGAAGAPERPSLALEYWFQTDDDRTPERRIRLVEPPAVIAATATISAPGYARPLATTGAGLSTGSHDLGTGRDERAGVGPVLMGSEITLVLSLNKPIAPPAHPSEAFPGSDLPSQASLAADGPTWTLSWTADKAVRLPVALKDEDGIASDRESVFQFNVVADRPPSAAVIEPSQDESVLATAVLSLTGEARDDVGLAWAQLDHQVAKPPAGSAGAPADPAGPPAPLGRRELTGAPSAEQRQAKVSAELRLATLGLKPKDEVWLTALAQDVFESSGAGHEPARSAIRRLRIISEAELVTQLQNELAAVRQAALRLDQEQAEISAKASAGKEATELRPAQEGLTQRLNPQSDLVRRLSQRVTRNALQDRALSGLLQDAAGLIDDAAGASAQAAAGLEKLERPQEDQDGKREQGAAVAREQKKVRDELGRLISMLDRGQDGWTARREVQRLLDEQRQLEAETRELGRQTTGKSVSEISPQQRDQLEQIAQQQSDLARRSQSAIEDLANRAEQLRKNDPAMAKAMQQAAQRGQESQVSETQREASEQVRENQTSAASQSQEEAADALQEMLDDLDESEQNRDDALRRTLEDVIQSLEVLVAHQESELALLAKVLGTGSFAGLDAGMIRLHGATLALTDRLRSTFRELASVADLLESASKAQQTAVVLLRGQDAAGTEAEQAELISLGKLREAKAEAQRLRDEAADRDQARKRAELRKAYREALEGQVDLHARTEEFVGKDLDRRQRSGVRALGERQQAIRQSLADLRKNTAEMAEARLFDFAHQRLDGATGRAADSMREGAVPLAVERDQKTAVRILQALVEALKEGKPGDFRKQADSDGGGGSGNGGSGGGLIPPLAELRLLRMMQQEAADLTKSAAESQPDVLDEVGQLQEDLARRAVELIQKTTPQEGAAAPGKDPPVPPNFGFEPPQEQALPPAADKKSQPAKEPPQEPVQTLDDLLGLPKSGDRLPKEGDEDPLRAELDRKLAPEEIGEQFQQTVHLMQETAQRLLKARDPGVSTQRLQDDIIRRLDQIIASAEQRQSQQSSSSSSSKSQQQRQQQPQGSQATAPSGENRGQANPPARQDGAGRTLQAGAGAAWGNLPDHIRDALVQGRSDRFSAIYQALTQAYYRRLAEEPKHADPRKEPKP